MKEIQLRVKWLLSHGQIKIVLLMKSRSLSNYRQNSAACETGIVERNLNRNRAKYLKSEIS